MRQFLALFVIAALFGMTLAYNEREEVEHVIAQTLKGEGANPHDFEKEAHLLNAHLGDDELHAVIHKYVEMSSEKQEAFKEKLIEGGKLFVGEEQKSMTPNAAQVKAWIKKAALDDQTE